MVPRGGRSAVVRAASQAGFNPCSPGWCPAGVVTARCGLSCRDIGFQSLFSWMVPAGTAWLLTIGAMAARFQSLFSWMVPRGRRARRSWSRRLIRCFNPCSPGWCTAGRATACSWPKPSAIDVSILVLLDGARGRRWRRWHVRQHVFQSLFSWMVPAGGRSSSSAVSRRRCFNPCSPGWCPAGGSPSAYRPWRLMVSILVLLDGARGMRSVRCEPLMQRCRVSILVLLDGAPRARRADVDAGTCADGFNPCSPGWCPAGGTCRIVDALWRPTFQSLFSWMVHRGRSWPPLDAHARRRFQSLFSWMVPRGGWRQELADYRIRGFNPCSPGWCPAAADDRRDQLTGR